jgi:cytochrome b561
MHQEVGFPVPRDRYTRVAIALHWAIATFIIFNLCTGFFFEGFPPPLRILALTLHVSSGLTVLALTVVRVFWRLLNEPPPYLAGMKPWERHTAHFVHFLLYAGMVLMPLTGWAMLSAHAPPGSPGAAVELAHPPGPPPGEGPAAAPPGAARALPPGMPMFGGPPPAQKIWGLVPMPMIGPIQAIGKEPGGLPAQRALHEKFEQWHGVGGLLLLSLLILHILGALKHQFIDREPELARMGIGSRKRS